MRGRTETNDVKCSDRSNKAVTPENVKQVLKIVMDSCKEKIRKSSDMINISTVSA